MKRMRFGHFFAAVFLPVMCFAQGSVLLVGGGGENYNDWSDEPYRWLVNQAPNKKILVMHYSTSSSFLPGYFQWLGATSAANLVVPSASIANDSATYRAILAVDGIFLRGGDQWQYISKWKGTLTEKAIKEVFQRGGVVGGTSAGEAVLSQTIFDARITSVDPRTALRNPLGAGISFTEDFLGVASGILADSHFYERGRLGRLLAMMAYHKSQTGKAIVGVGIDYNTAMGISPDGIGAVMGAGTVTVLRWQPNSTYALGINKPLTMTNIRMDQLTSGYTFAVAGGQIQTPTSATSFTPKSASFHAKKLYLDGSGASSDWFSATGSITRFLSPFSAIDTVGIFSSPASATNAASVDLYVKQKFISSQILWIDESRKNDAALAAAIRHSSGYIFAGNNPDSIAGLLNKTTEAGKAFFLRIDEGKPVLMLSNDAVLAADSGVGQTEKDIYAAYYGYLTLIGGLGLVNGVEIMPRVFENSDYTDNRASGFFWGLVKSRMSYGALFDAGTHVSLSNTTLQVFGATPAIIIDARNVQSVDFPSFKDPGKSTPRQNAAMVNALIHVIPDSGLFDVSAGSVGEVSEQIAEIPKDAQLHQNYPNPFNPSTRLQFTIPAGKAHALSKLLIYDILGREVATLVNENLNSGTYAVYWDGHQFASGTYFARLLTGNTVITRKLLRIK